MTHKVARNTGSAAGRNHPLRVATSALLCSALAAGLSLAVSACGSTQPNTPVPPPHRGDAAPASAAVRAPAAERATRARVQGDLGKIPLHFEANQGQAAAPAQYLARGPGYSVHLTPTESVIALRHPAASSAAPLTPSANPPGRGAHSAEVSTLRAQLVGANPRAAMHALQELPGKGNYFVGNDPRQWRTDIPLYGKVEARAVYPGIDLVYYGNPQQLEYDFVVAPGADPGSIRLAFDGQTAPLRTDAEGNLVIALAGGEVTQKRPVAYQEINGSREPVSARFVLHPVEDPESLRQEVGFAVARYDRERSLVIDPVLAYSTYIGQAWPFAIAVDPWGSAYLAGEASAYVTLYPIQNAYQPSPGGGASALDAFITKLTPDGSALVYSTYLGGGHSDYGSDIAVDVAGNVYLAGLTQATNFPTTSGALQTALAGGVDGFVTKLNAAGNALLYSTYLGGGGDDYLRGIAVDAAGNAYAVGQTDSADFPTTPSAYSAAMDGAGDAFVAKLTPGGDGLEYSTYLGGSGGDGARAVEVDAAGNAYVFGTTGSGDFPTVSPFQATMAGTSDIFLTKLTPAGSALVYSTYLGGTQPGWEFGRALAVDASGSATVVGETDATDFPVQAALQPTNPGSYTSGFVTRFTPAGNALVYSTYLGGGSTSPWPLSVQTRCSGVAVDAAGNAFVTGYTTTTDFPILNAVQGTNGGDVGGNSVGDAFVTKFNPLGSLVYSTFLGGTGSDRAEAIALRPGVGGNSTLSAYITGLTGGWLALPADFPTQNPFRNYRSCFGNPCLDLFASKIQVGDEEAVQAVGAGGTATTDSEADGATPADPIEVSVTSPNAGTISILEAQVDAAPPTFEFDITAPDATAATPLILTFRVDASVAPTIYNNYKNLNTVPGCAGAAGTASPDPCISSTATLPDGDLQFTMYTSKASLWSIRGCDAATGCPDVALSRLRPLKVTIPAGKSEVVKKLSIKVRNVAAVTGSPPSESVMLSVDDSACPVRIASGADFDRATAGTQNSTVLARRTAKKASVLLTIPSAAFSSFNGETPQRCALRVTAQVTSALGGDDPTPSNNTLAVDLNVIDENDAAQTATHESLIVSAAPVTIKIPDGATSASKKVTAKVTNADVGESPGDSIALQATADPACPGLTLGAVDCDTGTAGDQPAVVVAGTETESCRLVLTADANSFTTPSADTPHRCVLTLTATGPSDPQTAPLDASNNTTALVVNVIDKNDY